MVMENYPFHEPMKYRFKKVTGGYPISIDEIIWSNIGTERGHTLQSIKAYKAKARKPYWRKKRREQRRQHPKTKGVAPNLITI